MEFPVQITYRDVANSDAIQSYIQERAAKLATFYPRISRCHVVVEAPHHHRKRGYGYHLVIDLRIPGHEVAVSHEPPQGDTHQDLYAAIDDAFDEAQRKLEDAARQQRGDVKARSAPSRHGRITKYYAYEGFGFIEPEDGGEVYFHRNSVLHEGFNRMGIGMRVRFVEEDGDKGPQASTVELLG